ncbi:MAG: histidinol-phosphate aminotransferase [Paraglaciecola sp.]|jgi:histidinol-phosphate aminotransferase
MNLPVTVLSRRQFIQRLGSSAALLGLASHSCSVLALANDQLAMRQGAVPLKLNFNENSLGMSGKALNAAQIAVKTAGNRYPGKAVSQLREQLAMLHQVSPDMIILGNGSTEVIGGIVALAAKSGAKVLEPNPTFGDVRRYSQAEGLEVITVPVGAGFTTDIDALKKRSASIKGPLLINLCNPNNPTGSSIEWTQLETWLKAAPDNHMFLVDEAYYEYAQANPKYQSALKLIKQGQHNVVITRTFSKIYGMAGMRIGYGIATSSTAQKIRPFAAGNNLSIAGLAGASASLKDEEFYTYSLNSNQQAKSILLSTLDELQLDYIPSDTNFVLHKIATDLSVYADRMKQNGITVGRKMTPQDNWNRISIGTPQEMNQFAATLRAFRIKGWV